MPHSGDPQVLIGMRNQERFIILPVVYRNLHQGEFIAIGRLDSGQLPIIIAASAFDEVCSQYNLAVETMDEFTNVYSGRQVSLEVQEEIAESIVEATQELLESGTVRESRLNAWKSVNGLQSAVIAINLTLAGADLEEQVQLRTRQIGRAIILLSALNGGNLYLSTASIIETFFD